MITSSLSLQTVAPSSGTAGTSEKITSLKSLLDGRIKAHQIAVDKFGKLGRFCAGLLAIENLAHRYYYKLPGVSDSLSSIFFTFGSVFFTLERYAHAETMSELLVIRNTLSDEPKKAT